MPRAIALTAIDQAYSEGVRTLFNVLRLEVTTSPGKSDERLVAFNKGLSNLNLARDLALAAIQGFEETST